MADEWPYIPPAIMPDKTAQIGEEDDPSGTDVAADEGDCDQELDADNNEVVTVTALASVPPAAAAVRRQSSSEEFFPDWDFGPDFLATPPNNEQGSGILTSGSGQAGDRPKIAPRRQPKIPKFDCVPPPPRPAPGPSGAQTFAEVADMARHEWLQDEFERNSKAIVGQSVDGFVYEPGEVDSDDESNKAKVKVKGRSKKRVTFAEGPGPGPKNKDKGKVKGKPEVNGRPKKVTFVEGRGHGPENKDKGKVKGKPEVNGRPKKVTFVEPHKGKDKDKDKRARDDQDSEGHRSSGDDDDDQDFGKNIKKRRKKRYKVVDGEDSKKANDDPEGDSQGEASPEDKGDKDKDVVDGEESGSGSGSGSESGSSRSDSGQSDSSDGYDPEGGSDEDDFVMTGRDDFDNNDAWSFGECPPTNVSKTNSEIDTYDGALAYRKNPCQCDALKKDAGQNRELNSIIGGAGDPDDFLSVGARRSLVLDKDGFLASNRVKSLAPRAAAGGRYPHPFLVADDISSTIPVASSSNDRAAANKSDRKVAVAVAMDTADGYVVPGADRDTEDNVSDDPEDEAVDEEDDDAEDVSGSDNSTPVCSDHTEDGFGSDVYPSDDDAGSESPSPSTSKPETVRATGSADSLLSSRTGTEDSEEDEELGTPIATGNKNKSSPTSQITFEDYFAYYEFESDEKENDDPGSDPGTA